MLDAKIAKALNGQINAELYSAYLYYSMSAWFDSKSLSGFASWMQAQAQEEMYHVTKFYAYINERGSRVIMEAIDKPQIDWESPLEVFEHVVRHEEMVTALINKLVDLALDERDHASNNFLQWFVSEQVEEEASVSAVRDRLKLVGDDSAGMFALDMELGKRIFTPPAKG
jgi:ferritin